MRADERLRAMAAEAVRMHPRDLMSRIAAFLQSCRNDADLLWALFAVYREDAALAALAEAENDLKEEEYAAADYPAPAAIPANVRADMGGRYFPLADLGLKIGRAATHAPREPDRGGEFRIGGGSFVTPVVPRMPRSPLTWEQEQTTRGETSATARRAILDTFYIDGMQLGCCTLRMVRREIDKKERDTRFLVALTAGCSEEERTMGDYYRGESGADEAYRLWLRAQQDAA